MESFLNLFEEVTEINGGYSGDRKFKCINEDGQAYLCRFFKMKDMAKASAHYELLRQFKGDKDFQQIQYILKCNDGIHGVLVFDWVDGEPLDKSLENSNQQFELGQQAGRILNKLHNVKTVVTKTDDSKRISQLQKQLEELVEMGGDFDSLDSLVNLFKDNKDNYQSDEVVHCHGDFHASNMILTKENKIVLIDFDRQGVMDKSEDIEPLIFWDPVDFVNGVLDEIEFNDQTIVNTKILLYAAPRSVLWTAKNGFVDSLDKIIDKNNNIITKLNGLNKFSKL